MSNPFQEPMAKYASDHTELELSQRIVACILSNYPEIGAIAPHMALASKIEWTLIGAGYKPQEFQPCPEVPEPLALYTYAVQQLMLMADSGGVYDRIAACEALIELSTKLSGAGSYDRA